MGSALLPINRTNLSPTTDWCCDRMLGQEAVSKVSLTNRNFTERAFSHARRKAMNRAIKKNCGIRGFKRFKEKEGLMCLILVGLDGPFKLLASIVSSPICPLSIAEKPGPVSDTNILEPRRVIVIGKPPKRELQMQETQYLPNSFFTCPTYSL